jgi:hypothetical protein
MSQLKIGDEIRGVDSSGSVVMTPVRAWLHRDVNAQTTMTVVNTNAGVVVASPRHLLATGKQAYSFASELSVGRTLVREGKDAALVEDVTVESISETQGKGLYAPLTLTTNYFVGEVMSPGVLAHSFAELRHPQWYERTFHAMLTVAEFFKPKINAIDANDQAYLHPVAAFFMKMLGWSSVVDQRVIV